MPAKPDGSGAWASPACVGVLLGAAPAFAQFDRGQISGVIKDRNRRRHAGRHGYGHASGHADGAHDRHGRERLLHVPEPVRGPVQHQRRASRIQEGGQGRGAAGCGRLLDYGFLALHRRAHRAGDRHGGADAAPDRHGSAQDRRGERHRAAVVQRPQPDWRGRPEAGRHRRQLQQLRLLGPRQRRLQHQRQPPGRREQHHRGRRDRDPHPHRTARSSASRTSTPSRKCRS